MTKAEREGDEASLPDGGDYDLQLHRALGPVGLVSLGIGVTIGAGIFVITGTAAATYAGPAIVLSFVIAGIGCLFAALCYAELASMIPISGSAYTYAYATMGRFMAWFIGWDLVLEYGISASAVAVSWSGYLGSFLNQFGIVLPTALSSAPLALDAAKELVWTGALFNVPAAALIVFLTAILVIGVRATAGFNNLMVLIKVSIIFLIIIFGLPLIKLDNLTPFIPPNTTGEFGHFGWSGVLRASGVIFFAYIGFDSVSVAAQESINPQRDMPIGILGTLVVCTVLYILMAVTMTGLLNYTELGVPNPASAAIGAAGPGLAWLKPLVDIAAITGLATVVFVALYGQARIFYSMARDGFLPPIFSAVHRRFRTPHRGTIVTGLFAAIFAGLLPLDILGELVSIGTLAAFVIVCIAVMVLRATAPKAARGFRTPFVPLTPLLGILVCGAMMYWLPPDTWIRMAIWFAIGLVIYFLYGIRHARESKWSLEDMSHHTGEPPQGGDK
jgi:APA family basic amino acid/polyamine antiporter